MTKLNNNDIFQLIYGVQNKEDRPGWTTLHEFDDIAANKDFTAKTYKKGNTIVISLAGSKEADDFKNALSIMNSNKIPPQYWDAKAYYERVRRKYPNADIEFTGYSLGASLANLLSLHTGLPSSVIAPVGSKHIAAANKKEFTYDDSRIKSFGRKSDNLFNMNLDKQSGQIYIIPDLEVNRFPSNKLYSNLNRNINNRILRPHLLGNYNGRSLDAAVPYQKPVYGYTTGFAAPISRINEHIFTPQEIGEMTPDEFYRNLPIIEQQLKDGLIKPKAHQVDYSGYVNPVTGDGKIFSREAISQMTGDEYTGNESAIMAQLKSIGIPYDSDLDLASMRGGLVYVRPYTREDGTEVRGYWRSAPMV